MKNGYNILAMRNVEYGMLLGITVGGGAVAVYSHFHDQAHHDALQPTVNQTQTILDFTEGQLTHDANHSHNPTESYWAQKFVSAEVKAAHQNFQETITEQNTNPGIPPDIGGGLPVAGIILGIAAVASIRHSRHNRKANPEHPKHQQTVASSLPTPEQV